MYVIFGSDTFTKIPAGSDTFTKKGRYSIPIQKCPAILAIDKRRYKTLIEKTDILTNNLALYMILCHFED